MQKKCSENKYLVLKKVEFNKVSTLKPYNLHVMFLINRLDFLTNIYFTSQNTKFHKVEISVS